MKILIMITSLLVSSHLLAGIGLEVGSHEYTKDQIAAATRGGSVSIHATHEIIQMLCIDYAATNIENCTKFSLGTISNYSDDSAIIKNVYIPDRSVVFTAEELNSRKSIYTKIRNSEQSRTFKKPRMLLRNTLVVAASGPIGSLLLQETLGVFTIPVFLISIPISAAAAIAVGVIELPLQGINTLVWKNKTNRYFKSVVNNNKKVHVVFSSRNNNRDITNLGDRTN